VIEAVLFYILAAVLVGTGLMVITRTNPIASALAMVATFSALAALYALLSAGLVAIIQILVYAGGIMVLMIFVIMLLNLHPDDLKPMKAKALTVIVALAGVLVGVFGPALWVFCPSTPLHWGDLTPGFGNIATVGEKIFIDNLFPFEMLSLLLLVAVVGAIVLAKRKL